MATPIKTLMFETKRGRLRTAYLFSIPHYTARFMYDASTYTKTEEDARSSPHFQSIDKSKAFYVLLDGVGWMESFEDALDLYNRTMCDEVIFKIESDFTGFLPISVNDDRDHGA